VLWVSAEVTVDIQGEKFQLSVVVIEPLITEAILGLDLSLLLICYINS